MKIRACELEVGDRFEIAGTQFKVRKISEKEIIYRYWNITENKVRVDDYFFGRKSQRWIEKLTG